MWRVRNALKKVSARAGFSLLEVLISVAILAMITVLSWQSSAGILRGQDAVSDRDQMVQSARVAFEKIFLDVTQAFLVGPDYYGVKKTSTPAFIGQSEALHLASLSARRYLPTARGSDQAEVGYYLEADDEIGPYRLMRREATRVDDKPEEGGEAYPIAQGVKQIAFEYYDPLKKEWLRDWDSSKVDHHDKLPTAVRVVAARKRLG